MADSKIIYTPRADATPEREVSVLVAAYRFIIFDCHANEKGAGPGALADAERLKNDCTDTEIIPK
jgi:hypothetical protein